tara:strand:- start:655 stop:945 length:291 start_codon:yes stop_codon:yes gene_type:complete
MTKWYVTVDKYCSYPDENSAVWTLSRDPDVTGWETDSGFSGYGMLKADAEELANAADRIEELENALDQLLDDMGEDGLCVCQAAKDQAIEALGKSE